MKKLSTGNGLHDVVVTAVAMTTALATDVDNTWKKLLDGQSGMRGTHLMVQSLCGLGLVGRGPL